MKCPACGKDLNPVETGEMLVDICADGCGGIWFDNFELKKVDEPHESAALLRVGIPEVHGIQIDPSRRRNCPRCEVVVMMRHFFSRRRQVEVDVCPNCGGHWLDAGELSRIRKECELEQAERKAKADFAAGIPVNKPGAPS